MFPFFSDKMSGVLCKLSLSSGKSLLKPQLALSQDQNTQVPYLTHIETEQGLNLKKHFGHHMWLQMQGRKRAACFPPISFSSAEKFTGGLFAPTSGSTSSFAGHEKPEEEANRLFPFFMFAFFVGKYFPAETFKRSACVALSTSHILT